jgi:hypothetical protein
VTLTLLLIGVVIALDPIPLTAFFIVLPSKRGVRKGAAFVFGWLVSLAVVVSVTVLATGNDPPKSSTAPTLASLAVKIAIGVALVVIGVRERRKQGHPKKPKKPPKWQAGVDNMSPWFAMALGPLTQPWGLIAAGAATVVSAKVSNFESALALILFCIIASSTYIAMEVYAGFWPEQAQVLLGKIRNWIDGHTDQVIIIGSLLLGFWLIGNSIYLILQ